jgi:pSer/pThr/pTyr-binding forkhead associated (FHA) protein
MIASQVLDEHMPSASIDTSMVDEPTLMVQTGDLAGTSFVLSGEMSEWSIGSDSTRNFVINQSGISASHAVIVREGSKWKVCDQMSVNGTFVNGKRTNISYINSGDVIRCGPVECVFAIPSGFVARGGKNTGMRIPRWMIGAGVAILLLLGGAWFAYSAGLFTKPPPAAVTDSQ